MRCPKIDRCRSSFEATRAKFGQKTPAATPPEEGASPQEEGRRKGITRVRKNAASDLLNQPGPRRGRSLSNDKY